MKDAVAILCAGGPAPGINTVISSVTKIFNNNGFNVLGINGGYKSLFSEEPAFEYLDFEYADQIYSRGGSALKMSRYKPKDEEFKTEFFKKYNVKLIVTIGGDDTASTANRLTKYLAKQKLDVKNIHVPKTIDNDLEKTVITFGFDTAVSFATECIDRLHATARSHNRVMVVEVMGRYAGWIALNSGISSSADVILIPEIPYNILRVAEAVERKEKEGIRYSIVVIAEGAKPLGHFGAGGNPVRVDAVSGCCWIPACAGMTGSGYPGERQGMFPLMARMNVSCL